MSTKAVRKAIVSTLQTVVAGVTLNGHTCTYTLSGPSQVVSGKYERPPASWPASHPFACVWTVGVEESGAALSAKEQAGQFSVLCWVPASLQSAEARQDAAEDMLDDLRAALRAAPKLGLSYVVRVLAPGTAFADEEDQSAKRLPWGICAVGVLVVWREAG